jgi:predicted ATPase
MFGFRVNGDSKPITARVISDGTLRALGVLTALETNPRGKRIIVEEFDNGVHPSRVQVLTEAMFECSKRNGLHSLVTTHNPATLNALDSEQLSSVLLVLRTGKQLESQLIPLPELPGYIEFIEKGRLGDLITKRIYEQHLSGRYEEERKEIIEDWVNNLP